MPHIKLELTENIEPSRIKLVFKELRIILMENSGVKEKNCKCKAIRIPNYSVGNNDLRHFCHLEISILIGRSEDVKHKIGLESIKSLKKYFISENDEKNKQFSVEIREMNSKNYFTTNTF